MKQIRLWDVVCACAFSLFSLPAHAVAISGQGTWETTLQARDLDGNTATVEAYYDVAQDITWLADANYPMTSGYDADGWMPWDDAVTWASSLTVGGIGGWRLPRFTDTAAPGCDQAFVGTDCGMNVDTATSELSYMFYVHLGNLSYYDTSGNAPQPGWENSNTGPFDNLQYFSYWSDSVLATDSNQAWHFDFILGHQGGVNRTADQYVWAVQDGDIGTAVIPVPAAAWLFTSGLLGLAGMARTGMQRQG